MKRMIFILGMHRSGTSALTRVLNLAGLKLGIALVEKTNDNPKGFFEDSEAMRINNDFTFLSKSDWIGKTKLNFESSHLVDLTKHHIRTFLKDRFQNRKMFGLKDPRLCRTLPLWQEVLTEMNIQPLYVMAVRNPLEVAKSLEKRNNYDEKTSLDAWLQYTLEAEKYTRGGNRIIISYDEVLKNPINVIKKVSEKLEIKLDSSRKTEEKLNEFLDVKLRHSTISLKDLKNNPNVSKDIFELYKSMAEGKYPQQLPAIPQIKVIEKIIEKTNLKAIEEIAQKIENENKKHAEEIFQRVKTEINNQFAKMEQKRAYEKKKKSFSFLVIKFLGIFVPSKKLRKKMRNWGN